MRKRQKQSEKYWENRYKQLEKAQHKASVKKSLETQEMFDRAQANITKQINAWYGRFAVNNEITIADARKLLTSSELKEFKWDVNEYINYGRENAIDGRWMKELENASAKFHISRLEALKVQTQNECEKLFGNVTDSIDEHIKGQYTESYYHSAFEIMKGQGVGWEIGEVNSDKLSSIVSKPWAADGKTFRTREGEDKITLINNIHNSLTQMCVNGENPDKVIAQLAKTMKNDKARASRIIMTESAYFSQEAQKQCYSDLDVEEFEIVVTLDSDTDDECASRDGDHHPMSLFQAGVTAPPFHPNCRCCTAPYFNDEFSIGERIARQTNGEVYYVPANTIYRNWEKAFVGKKSNPTKAGFMKLDLQFFADKKVVENNNSLLSFAPVAPSDAVPTARKEFEPWIKSLSEDARTLIERYTYNQNDTTPKFFERINSFIRNGYKGEKDYGKQINIISDALKTAHLQNDYICYRGSNFNPFDGVKVGEIRKANQFLSTTLTESVAFDGKYDIIVYGSKGTNAAYIEDLSFKDFKKQREMLFDKDVEYEILFNSDYLVIVRSIP